MRILHTADWHLGRRLNRVDRLDEQRAILDELVEDGRMGWIEFRIADGGGADVQRPWRR